MRYPRGFDTREADAWLSRHDRELGRWIARVGVIGPQPQWRGRFDPADALARAILYQQLSGKAAAAIVGRVETAIGSCRLHADTLGRVDDATLRACGVSGNKCLALRDLSRREAEGGIPSMRRLAWMDERAIVDALVRVRGIGRWTVEMMLMFRLGRADVLPVDDLGVRKGMQVLDGLDAPPTAKAMLARGERWAPFRTQASFYLWRIADSASRDKTPVPRSRD
ncbi:DNA-3-methyladenine glycosylase 2 family protein [Lysobacter pythonis]|uniref:DNA-3-methyladenine glycosylase II n=1 Tax=Solilutibacter pythonis TaxID=2483112 RepID=A0A3M2HTH1_9GAMM|nr:DNA-3-methyladenine glycosylase [Lysobacter pythonis]RMH93041.1 DNA-3-methyladenine glycosylase 2 family protein [Lysobacter pythonis]